MTERLYYHDASLTEFTARVEERADDGRRIYLDRTAFYPTSGGQPHDVGTLGGARVVDVVDEGARIAHLLDVALPVAEQQVELRGAIDWERRYDHMQQHTGQHLLSAVIEDQLNLQTVSVHFGPEASTVDVAAVGGGTTSILDPAVIGRIEARVNAIVGEARPVTVTFEESAAATGLRKQTDRDGLLRVVTIAGVDRSACGGTHVATTAAIGLVQLRRQERVKQGLRIEFVCGRRAIARARRDLGLLAGIARVFSASLDDAQKLVEVQAIEVRELQSGLKKAAESVAKFRAAELHAAAEPNPAGLRVVVERAESGVDAERSLALAFAGLPRAMFVVASRTPPSILLATSPDSGVDAGKVLRPLLERVGGRGGGSPRLAQGSAQTTEAIDEVVRWLTSVEQAGAS
jgi:alanyl-tRNA synthetase